MSKTQPKYIEANYVASQLFDLDEILEELKLSWDNIESYGIKWGILYLNTKDGKTHEWDEEPNPVDYKRPYDTHELDEDYQAV